MKEPFTWDSYSDQPALLQDKTYKNTMRKKALFSLIKTFCIALCILPISLVAMPFIKRKQINSSEFFCLGIDAHREAERSVELVEELGLQRVLLRFKLWEMDSLDTLKTFLQRLPKQKVTLKILQDREHIKDVHQTEKDLETIFSSLDGLVDIYEIGSSINRSKWGIFSVDEYAKFFEVAHRLKEKQFPHIRLIGSGVIDFEYHFTAHTLFNCFSYKFDGVSSLLYVDRRGAPEHTQLGFALSDKIAWLSTMVWMSPKSQHALHITETNYPLTDTAPYAPTSEHECVSEELYANFMLRYHLLTFASQQVNSLSWHQLFARGYGLIDTINGLRYRPAFYTYKYMLHTLQEAQFLRLDITRGYHIFQCLIHDRLLQIHWALKNTTLKNEDFFEVYSKDGKAITDAILNIGSSPLYLFIDNATPKKVNCL